MLRPLRQAVLASAALLLTGAVLPFVLSAACASNEAGSVGDAPVRNTPVPLSTNSAGGTVINVTGTGSLDPLPVKEVRVGDEIVVTGSEWTNTESPVRFYLLTREQVEERAVLPGEVVKLAEEWPEDGTISFHFRLADSYQTPNGDQVRIEVGQQWRVQACQNTEPVSGLRGAHCSAREPLTVVE